jgi:hypothetical protein
MIKNLIIYRFAESKRITSEFDKEEIKSSTLADCLENAKGRKKPQLKALMQLAKDEQLSLIEKSKEQNVLSLSCQFRVPKLQATGDRPFVQANYGIWVRKNSPLVVSFDAGRKLSNVGISLLSYSMTSDPGVIENVRFDKDFFLRLKNWATADSAGSVKGISFNKIDFKGFKFKKIVLNANDLENSKLFNDLFDSAEGVADMSLTSAYLDSAGRQLRFKLNYWGSLTLYTPDPLKSEISELIGAIEKISQF